ncbi:MAG TPA: filamentous hemagglutinin N-terminal domain-containing protein, partial [Candidatus Kapabacteria bacterium]|nr:filamentous hemagglutinin N-terminal domain-containing protein [Candidatus Kapabacteria bacterium]
MIQYGDARGCRGIAALALLFLSQEAAECIAQVVLDGKFGTSGALTGPQYQIPQEAGSVRGNNLFHSFQQFDLGANDVASFSGAANIQNILARVTGGNASSIDGTIRSEISGANFFFINPQGVIFGPNARVDVSGSFAFSSADYLKLADGARFVASLDADDSVLSTAPVSAFGFINSAPGSLQLQQTSLLANEGQKISLVGGEITLEGASVQAPGGDINVVAVSSPGEVPVNASYLNPAGFAAAFPNAGAIGMSGGAKLDTSGEGGGRIVIRGGSLVVDKSKIEANSLG